MTQKKRSFAQLNVALEDHQDIVCNSDANFGDQSPQDDKAFLESSQEDSDTSENLSKCNKSMRQLFQDFMIKQETQLEFTPNEVNAI